MDTFREVGGSGRHERLVAGSRRRPAGKTPACLINKLPFAAFNDPIAARKEVVRDRAEARGIEDPDATQTRRTTCLLPPLS